MGILGTVTGTFESQSTLPQHCNMRVVNIPSKHLCLDLYECAGVVHTILEVIPHAGMNGIPLVAVRDNYSNAVTGDKNNCNTVEKYSVISNATQISN